MGTNQSNSTRILASHICPGDSCNSKLTITVEDQPGLGGANHLYIVTGFDTRLNPSTAPGVPRLEAPILFQNGPIKEAGLNGITNEALLAIVEDRLDCFQAGPFACMKNYVALDHVRNAILALHSRTIDRL